MKTRTRVFERSITSPGVSNRPVASQRSGRLQEHQLRDLLQPRRNGRPPPQFVEEVQQEGDVNGAFLFPLRLGHREHSEALAVRGQVQERCCKRLAYLRRRPETRLTGNERSSLQRG